MERQNLEYTEDIMGNTENMEEKNLTWESQEEKWVEAISWMTADAFPMNPQIHEALGTSGRKK